MTSNHKTKTLQMAHAGYDNRNISLISDSELLTEIAALSEHALAVLLARYNPVLRTVIHRVINNKADVDEVLQDVYLCVWNQAKTYSEMKGKPLGWLITIARRRSIDHVRQRTAYQRATTRFEESLPHLEDGHHASSIVDNEVWNHELRALIDSHLQRLPAHQCEIVNLTFFKGLSQREISARLSLPLGTVKTRYELGIKKLSRSRLLQCVA